MHVIAKKITKTELIKNHHHYFKTLIKGVVDIKKEVIAVDAELHADLETELLTQGSLQENLWGINLYPEKGKEHFLEYTSLINIRPHQDNPAMEIQDVKLREKIAKIAFNLIDYDV